MFREKAMDYAGIANLNLIFHLVSSKLSLVMQLNIAPNIVFGFKLAGTLLMALWLIAFVFVLIFLKKESCSGRPRDGLFLSGYLIK